jgi:hypothetical protein
MSESSIPWPRKGDHLFKGDDDWWHNACLNFLPDQWGIYADGYKLAGDILVEHVKNARRNQDILVFPIVFLYRQYIELRVKEIIRDGNQLLRIPESFPKHHKINELWRECRRILESFWPKGPTDDLDAVEECIQQFSQKDPSSMAFRYPTDKQGNRSLPDLRHINLRNLSDVIDRIASLLDGASMGLSYYLEQKQEMEQESAW